MINFIRSFKLDYEYFFVNLFFPTGGFDLDDLCPINGARNNHKICVPFTQHGLDLAVANAAVLDLLLNSFFEKFVDIADGGVCLKMETLPTERARSVVESDELLDAPVAEGM